MCDPLEPRIMVGDVIEQLATLPDECVHTVVTSPPYFGLRDYGTGTWDGGDAGCDHARPTKTLIEGFNERWGQGSGERKQEQKSNGQYPLVCEKCGAVRVDRQIGLEPTLDAYIERMVGVFREVRRVLRADGTVWLNIGDSYVSAPKGPNGDDKSTLSAAGVRHQREHHRSAQTQDQKRVNGDGTAMRPPSVEGLKQKDMMMVPARLALALQADGWWLRKDIIWAKPNPMPESVTDRPTSSHEHVFLLAKQPRYFFDAEAVREPQSPDGRRQTAIASNGAGVTTHENYEGRQGGERWPNPGGRNMRDVWMISTEPYPDAHFATFPTKLVEPCILAGTSERGCCSECGAPWRRIVEVEYVKSPAHGEGSVMRGRLETTDVNGWAGESMPRLNKEVTTLGWEPSCACDAPTTACTVLDPFLGSGTTALVARRLGRASIGIELNPEYAEKARKRLERWWEKPKKTRVEVDDGQMDLLA